MTGSMKISSKIYIALSLIALGSVIYFAFPIIKSRYFNNGGDGVLKIENSNTEIYPPHDDDTPIKDNVQQDEEKEGEKTESAMGEGNPSEESFVDILRAQCESDCDDYKNDIKKLTYCQQVCGLSPTQIKPGENCENLNGLEKDYCLKNLGTNNKDFSICNKIQDENLKITCVTRITEDLLEKSTLSE